MKCADFKASERVKAGGRICKVVASIPGGNGWVTCVPIDKCDSVDAIINHSIKFRPNFVQKIGVT